MKKYVVTVKNGGEKFWLKSTTWAFRQERADLFDSQEAARAAAKEAETFMAPKIRKAYLVEEVTVGEAISYDDVPPWCLDIYKETVANLVAGNTDMNHDWVKLAGCCKTFSMAQHLGDMAKKHAKQITEGVTA